MILKCGIYMNNGMKYCRGCGEFKPVKQYYKSRNKGGLETLCKQCHLERYYHKKKDIPVARPRMPQLEDALL